MIPSSLIKTGLIVGFSVLGLLALLLVIVVIIVNLYQSDIK